MTDTTQLFEIRSKVSPSRRENEGFLYEIWKDYADGHRWGIKISRPYPTIAEAQKACEDQPQRYRAKWGARDQTFFLARGAQLARFTIP
jgi:hypothetical protein